MKEKSLKIDTQEALRVFKLLEEMNDLFHQPLKYKDPSLVEQFADRNYDEIKSLYYDVVWEWLPADIQEKIENE